MCGSDILVTKKGPALAVSSLLQRGLMTIANCPTVIAAVTVSTGTCWALLLLYAVWAAVAALWANWTYFLTAIAYLLAVVAVGSGRAIVAFWGGEAPNINI